MKNKINWESLVIEIVATFISTIIFIYLYHSYMNQNAIEAFREQQAQIVEVYSKTADLIDTQIQVLQEIEDLLQ